MRISHPTKLQINKLERNYELFTPESSRAIFTDEGYTVAFDEHQKLRTNNEKVGFSVKNAEFTFHSSSNQPLYLQQLHPGLFSTN